MVKKSDEVALKSAEMVYRKWRRCECLLAAKDRNLVRLPVTNRGN